MVVVYLVRVLWIVFEKIVLQYFGNISYFYWCIGMVGVGFLYGVYIQGVDGVGKFFLGYIFFCEIKVIVWW